MKIPDLPPDIDKIFKLRPEVFRAIVEARVDPAPGGRYRHWDKLRHLTPPKGLTLEEWWAAIKLARAPLLRTFPLRDTKGRPFRYAMPDAAAAMVHEIDRAASGRIAFAEPVTNPETKDFYLVSSLIEEAITSSQLEGASTTRRVAKEMIRSGRAPRDTDERMIHNNYRAMNHVRQIVAEPLTPDRVFELHRILTDGTLDKPSAAGRFRHADEDVYVGDRSDGAILHTPPPAEELPERLERMCDFANGVEQKQFIHPVAHSILLHFWLAYDHPFVDGNGRTARALFYWAMLKHDYWLTEYLSISRILRKAPAKYSRSFLYTETDENDATYFVLSQMSVIRQAIHDLTAFLQKKASEIRATEALIRQSVHLNHRQLALLSHALKHPNTSYTIEGHGKSHGVVYQTARTDLLDLESKKLLVKTKTGKSFSFHVPSKLSERLRKL